MGGGPRKFGEGMKKGFTTWLLSAMTLVFMPKCPMCLTAWVMAISGIALSTQVASDLRVVLLVVSALAFSVLTVRYGRRAFVRSGGLNDRSLAG